MSEFIKIYKKRIDMRDDRILIIQAATGERILKDVTAKAYAGGKEAEIGIVENEHSSLNYIFRNKAAGYDGEYDICVRLPEENTDVKIVLTRKSGNFSEASACTKIIKVSKSAISYLRKTMEYHIDSVRADGNKVMVTGWCASFGELAGKAVIAGKEVPCQVERYARENVSNIYLPGEINRKAGFSAIVEAGGKNKFSLELIDGNRKIKKTIHVKENTINRISSKAGDLVTKVRLQYEMCGIKGVAEKIQYKCSKNSDVQYDKYFKKNYPDSLELKRQQETVFDNPKLFSIVIPVYRPKEIYIKKVIESVINQTYSGWQLCLTDGGGEGFYMEKAVAPYVEKYGSDKIKYVKLKQNLGLSDNTNEAIKLADGDFIVFGDHDDEFHPSALYECMELLQMHPDAEFIYTDEDKIVGNTRKHTSGHFKSDFNLEMLRENNYICHMVAVKKELRQKVGMLIKEYDGAQDYDFVLRCSENTDKIYHIPKILYHWRIHSNSTAASMGTKSYAVVAGKKALEAHLKRCGIKAEVKDGVAPGYYRPVYDIIGSPLISAIIPNKDHIDDLKKAILSIEEKSTYKNIEYIVVENNSTQKETFAGYEELREGLGDRLTVVDYGKGEFNYSAINNFGVKSARGEYLLLLNNDTEIKDVDSIGSMLSYCEQNKVGIVGCKLLYNDNTVQHAGVILGYLGVAGHAFAELSEDDYGYLARAVISQDLSAVTAACMMVKKSVYDEVNGYDEDIKVSFNDIDFCMRVRKAGYRVIYDAYAKFYHYESKSRGLEDSPEKIERFNSEIKFFKDRWHKELAAGDPYYNPNFALDTQSYKLRNM